jgi:GGDEF domain-containing protein
MVAIPYALPIAVSEPEDRMVACLKSALRVRSQHAAVMRRAHSIEPAKNRNVPFTDLIAHSTVLCIGRGRNYPALTTAIGERVGLIGAMSVETAGRYLNAREIDGIAIGDGFSPRVVEALLTVLGEDVRFRDLPVGLLGRASVDDDRLANLVRVESDPVLLAERLIPFVRLQAFESRLQRTLKSLDSEGMVDPETGLLGRDAFWRDLDRAVQQAEEDGGALTVARFSFDDIADIRCSIDAARLFSRLMRNIDFACREQDGSIIAAFTETDLRNAHVVARRIAGILRNTMMSPDLDRRTIKPTVTLATLKPTDNLSTLVARVGTYPKLAAG